MYIYRYRERVIERDEDWCAMGEIERAMHAMISKEKAKPREMSIYMYTTHRDVSSYIHI